MDSSYAAALHVVNDFDRKKQSCILRKKHSHPMVEITLKRRWLKHNKAKWSISNQFEADCAPSHFFLHVTVTYCNLISHTILAYLPGPCPPQPFLLQEKLWNQLDSGSPRNMKSTRSKLNTWQVHVLILTESSINSIMLFLIFFSFGILQLDDCKTTNKCTLFYTLHIPA